VIPRAVSPSRWPANIGNDQLAGQDLEDISELLEGHNQAGRGITELFRWADGLVHLMSYRASSNKAGGGRPAAARCYGPDENRPSPG
jgi:hypothetical protein